MIENHSISGLSKKLLKNYRVKNLHSAMMKSFLPLTILLIKISNHLNEIQDFVRFKLIYYFLYIEYIFHKIVFICLWIFLFFFSCLLYQWWMTKNSWFFSFSRSFRQWWYFFDFYQILNDIIFLIVKYDRFISLQKCDLKNVFRKISISLYNLWLLLFQ